MCGTLGEKSREEERALLIPHKGKGGRLLKSSFLEAESELYVPS